MSAKSDQTRTQLLDAGERLFAERGVEKVSVAEITEAAGQRNGAAVHYHFGGRDGLLDAILERHHEHLDKVRLERLEESKARDSVTVRGLVQVVVEPMATCLETESGRAFLEIQAHRALALGGHLEDPSHAMAVLRRELASRLPPLPSDRAAERARLTTLMVNQRLGARADEEARGVHRPSRRVLTDTLVDAVVAVLTAPDDHQ